MKAKDVLEHFLSRADWVDRAKTVDRVIAGDPDKEVERCLVTWMPGLRALLHAVEQGIPLVIGHEPTFWNHHDQELPDDGFYKEKLRFIEEHSLAVMRIHDCWDKWPEIGITWAWAQFLGFEPQPVRASANGYQHRYDIAPTTLEKLAKRIGERCGKIGERRVQVAGDLKAQVSRVGVGTGCATDIRTYIELGCDCSVVCDDGTSYWGQIQRAIDLGHAVIRVNHGTSEEPGMVTLARYIAGNIKGLAAEHFPHGCSFRVV